ncbi:hypothetical protein [Halomicronema sp. CCY15110]|uniref:hypothetical protein n=1 Tax=Halomicronema sp. CCY15110 TaxID=2767773 RepID=UPI00194E6C5F|nr:hypothetical protein [Halomicronema sp. CCY15110]
MNHQPEQLELALEDAAETPAIADLKVLCQQFEAASAQLSVQEQLTLGSRVFERLAEIYQAKADWLLEDWENAHNPQDPNVPGGWLQGFVRQSQHVDLSDLTAPVQRRPRTASGKTKKPSGTVVGEVPKENVLKMLDEVELAEQKIAAIAVAHEERIEDWVAEIHAWFNQHPQPISLLDLQQALNWPLIQLWLSLLLGGFKLEAIDSSFYSLQILVSTSPP